MVNVHEYPAPDLGGEGIKARVIPHDEFALMAYPAKTCMGARVSYIFSVIEICTGHISEQMLPYAIEHERVELITFTNLDIKDEFKRKAPITSNNCHDLANAEIYRLAFARGELDFLHSQWLGEDKSGETDDSQNYRRQLYEYYVLGSKTKCTT